LDNGAYLIVLKTTAPVDWIYFGYGDEIEYVLVEEAEDGTAPVIGYTLDIGAYLELSWLKSLG